MYEIMIKGKINPIVVSFSSGQSIKQDWEKYKQGGENAVFETNDFSGTMSDIRYFCKKSPHQSQKINYQDYKEEYKKERNITLSQSPERRAKNLGLFKIIYYAFTGCNPSEDILQKATEIQKDFFTKNPKRMFPNPIIFKDIVKKNYTSQGMETHSRLSALRLVENTVITESRSFFD